MSKVGEEMDSRELLADLVHQAKRLLVLRQHSSTEGSLAALQDAVEQAESALTGQASLPFTRNREFLVPRTDEAVRFAARRYTMVPPFGSPDTVYTYYGLKDALDWFERQDLQDQDIDALSARAELALEQANKLLEHAVAGDGVGEYDPSALARLRQATAQLETQITSLLHDTDSTDSKVTAADREGLMRSIVALYNQKRKLRHSRRLLLDVDQNASLYFTGAELKTWRQEVRTNPLVRQRYEQIERLSNVHSLEELQRVNELMIQGNVGYEELNRHFYLWSSTDKIVNFKVPSAAKRATLSFILPSEENEAEGLGHVWIDDVSILSASGGKLQLVNGGFEDGEGQPLGWRPVVRKGSPILRTEVEYPFCGGGDGKSEPVNYSSQAEHRASGNSPRSVYICNPSPSDEGAWVYDGDFAVEGGMGCTLTFAAKLDGKLKRGLRVLIVFKDEQGESIGEFEYYFNRKSWLPGGKFQLGMQCDAIRYAVTEDRAYAEKSKLAMLYILNDFCQGAEHWMVTNLRPEGSDSYGAVQAGRLLCVIAVSYSLISTAGVFSGKEKQHFYAMLEYLLRYVLDLRDRTEWTMEEAQRGCSNWQTDMCAGAGYLMLVLPDFPNRHVWLNNANAVLLAQLQLKVNSDGSWPESIRYHHAALERFAGYAKVLNKMSGENWFTTTRLADMFRYPIEVQTPKYAYFGGRIGTPPFGDHALGGGEEFGYFPIFIPEIAEIEPELANRMYHTWVAAGKPVKKLWGESVVLENLLVADSSPSTDRSRDPEMASNTKYADAGVYIFRQPIQGKLSYFAIMSSPKPVSHGHLDQGSFILYAQSVPLVMDSGIEGYFDSSASWHICSYSHACVQFASQQKFSPSAAMEPETINLSAGTFSLERGWVDVPRSSRVVAVREEQEVESITIEIANPEGEGRHLRSVAHVKGTDLYLIRDEIIAYDGKVLFTLPVASLRSHVEGNRVYSECAYGMALDTLFLGAAPSIQMECGRTTPFFPSGDKGEALMDYVRAIADAKEGFLTVLSPRSQSEPELEAVPGSDGSVMLRTAHAAVRVDVDSLLNKDGRRSAVALHDAISIMRGSN